MAFWKTSLSLTILMSTTSLAALPVYAADFTVLNGQTIASATLGNNETGLIENGGTVTGDVDPSGSTSPTLTNNGTIGGSVTDFFSTNFMFTNNGIVTGAVDSNVTSYATIINTGTINSFVTADTSDHYVLINTGSINSLINLSSATNASATNSGTITGNIAGDNSQNTTFTNAGTLNGGVYVTGSQNFSLVLQGGSTITGNVDFTGATNGLIRLESGISYPSEGGGFGSGSSGSVTAPTVSGGVLGVNYNILEVDISSGLASGAHVVTSGSTSYAVTPDVFASAENTITQQSLNHASTLVVSHQLSGSRNTAATQEQNSLNLEPAAGDTVTDSNNNIWIEGFGLYQERPKDGDSAYTRTQGGGLLIGIDFPENDDGYTHGIYVGSYKGQVRMGKTGFRTIDSQGFMVGGYMGTYVESTYVSVQLTGGYSGNDSDRTVSNTTAHAQYNSYYISPSLTIAHPLEFDESGFKLTPSLSVFYTGQYSGSYDESGSSANESVQSRFYHTAGARAVAEGELAPSLVGSSVITPSFRVGVSYETALGDRDVDLTVLGSDVSLHTEGGSPHVDGLLGAHIDIKPDEDVTLYVDIEGSLGLNKGNYGDDYGGTARVGAKWAF